MKKLATIIAVALFVVGMICVSINTRADSQQESVFLADSPFLNLGYPYVFFPCANPERDWRWTYLPAFSTMKCGSANYLAYGKGGIVTSPTFTLPAHQGIIVTFKLALIDSWDGETFSVTADGVTVFKQTYNWTQPGGSQMCSSGYPDRLIDVKFGFSHTASTVALSFFSNLDEDASNEAWGICDVTIVVTNYSVDQDGSPGAVFRCSNVGKEDSWQYPPSGFQTVKCGSYATASFLFYGNEGKNGKLTSPSLYLGAHQQIYVRFRLALLDSWDNEYLKIAADGKEVWSLRWNSKDSRENSCNNPKYDDWYKDIAFSFAHTAPSAVLSFYSTLNSGAKDESWGICDLIIKALP